MTLSMSVVAKAFSHSSFFATAPFVTLLNTCSICRISDRSVSLDRQNIASPRAADSHAGPKLRHFVLVTGNLESFAAFLDAHDGDVGESGVRQLVVVMRQGAHLICVPGCLIMLHGAYKTEWLACSTPSSYPGTTNSFSE